MAGGWWKVFWLNCDKLVLIVGRIFFNLMGVFCWVGAVERCGIICNYIRVEYNVINEKVS